MIILDLYLLGAQGMEEVAPKEPCTETGIGRDSSEG